MSERGRRLELCNEWGNGTDGSDFESWLMDKVIELEEKLHRRGSRARKPPAAVSAIRSAIARAAWGKLSADQRKARQRRVWAKRKEREKSA